MIPLSHHGLWAGPSRLWHPDPLLPRRSNGEIDAAPGSLAYRWSVDGEDQRGTLVLAGPVLSLRGEWQDSWHTPGGMTAHGRWDGALLCLWSTYQAGDETWGWRIEVEARDPEHLVLRMFNVLPDGLEQIAHDLRGARQRG